MTWATIIKRASSINHWSGDDRARLDALRRQVATKLRAYRRKHRLTQSQAAHGLGIDPASWQRWELRRALPGLRVLKGLANSIGD